MNFRVSARILLLGAAVLSASCINKDYQLGRGLIDTAQHFDIVNGEFPLSEIRMEMADSLSGYSSTRRQIPSPSRTSGTATSSRTSTSMN